MRSSRVLLRGKRVAIGVVLLSLSHSPVLATTALQQSVVFQSGVGGYNAYRIPSIVQSTDGSLLAFAEGRKNSSADSGDIDIVLKRSSDGGATWGALQVIYSNGTGKAGNPAPVVDAASGKIILSFDLDDSQPAYVTSTNNGQSWSAITNITASAKLSTWNAFFDGPGHAIQLQRGPHAGRILVSGAHTLLNTNLDPAGRESQFIYSDDAGATWHVGGSLKNADGAINPGEATAVELTDGRVYMNTRNQAGSSYRVIGYSNDSGLTFSGPAQVETQLIDPIVEGAVVRYSAIDKGAAQNRILFSNPDSQTARVRMTIKSSFDETATWNSGKLVNRGPSGYSDLVTYANGAGGGLLYENGPSTYHDQITYGSFTSAWLDDPSLAQYDFRGRSPGQTVATNSSEPDQRGNGVAGVIEGNPTTVAGDPHFSNVSPTALHFDGVDDLLRVTDSGNGFSDFEATDSFTLEADFRTTAHTIGGATSSGPLISKDVGSNSPSYWLRVENGHLRFFVDDGTNTTSITGNTNLSDGAWHHVAAVRDVADDELLLYVDNNLDGTIADTTTGSFANANDLLIGAFNASSPGSKRFQGDIAFARLSEGALLPGQFVQPVPEPSVFFLLASLAFVHPRRPRP